MAPARKFQNESEFSLCLLAAALDSRRATEWSGKPDRIEIQISIYDDRRNEVATTVVSGKSKWVTFGDYIRSLY